MKDNPTIPSAFVRGALQGYLSRSDGSSSQAIEHILRDSGINKDMLMSHRGRIGGQEFARLITHLWTLMDDEFIGFGSQKVKPGAFALMCQLAIGASTLRQALIRCIRFQKVVAIMPELNLIEEDGRTSLVLTCDHGNLGENTFIFESLLVIYHRFCCWLIDHTLPLMQVSFAYPAPEYASEYKKLFDGQVVFDADKTAVVFDSQFLSFSIAKDNLQLQQFLKAAPFSILFRPRDDKSFTAKVRRIIARQNDTTMPKFEDVASDLFMTPQTLRRRLKDEGLTFNEVKEQYRRDLAIFMLTRSDSPIKRVAEVLGFTETSAFQRAFKQWTGVTPSIYRQRYE